jgi:uncharacterized protein YbbK (DUF523 family)
MDQADATAEERRERALSEASEILGRHVPRESARVITERARNSLSCESGNADDFTEELLAKISQASAVFLAPRVRFQILGELRMSLRDLPR